MSEKAGDPFNFENQPSGADATAIDGLPVDLTGHAAGDVLEINGTNDAIISSPRAAPGLHHTTHELGGSDELALDATQITAGNLALPRIATALAAGGDPIKGTIVDATTRIDTPTIGTAAGTQHALPSGTAALLAADSALDGANLTANSVTAAKLATTAVTAAPYPATGQIPTVTFGVDGRATAAGSTTNGSALTNLPAANLVGGPIPIGVIPTGSSSSTVTIGNDTRLPPTPSTAGKVVVDTGSAYIGAAVITTKYTSAGTSTWTANANTKRVYVQIWGGGAGGASGRQGTVALSTGGTGGGSGGYSALWYALADISSPQTVIVGAGGSGGTSQASTSTDGRVGTAGSVSSFGSLLRVGVTSVPAAGTTTTTSSAGSGVGMFPGSPGSGAPINASGPNNGATVASGLMTGGGGAGGGTIAASFGNGGAAQYPAGFFSSGTAIVNLVGANGNPGTSSTTGGGSLGGGGGASGDAVGTVPGGTGGAGGSPGGGGGGGGASVNGAASGAGGAGADGAVWITEYPF